MTQKTERWGICLDDLTDEIFRGLRSEAIGAHYFAFDGTRDEVLDKMAASFRSLCESMIYPASHYGSKWTPEDDEEDEE